MAGGKASEHQDKKIASRCWRRLIKRSAVHADWDSYLVPDRREAGHNNRCTWLADGRNRLWVFPSKNVVATLLCGDTEGYERLRLEYEKLRRK
jgi:hypothetical protein